MAVTFYELEVAMPLPVCKEWQSRCLKQKWTLPMPILAIDIHSARGRGRTKHGTIFVGPNRALERSQPDAYSCMKVESS